MYLTCTAQKRVNEVTRYGDGYTSHTNTDGSSVFKVVSVGEDVQAPLPTPRLRNPRIT